MNGEKKYYYISNESPVGPASFEELVQLFREGKVNRKTLVTEKGNSEWRKLSDCADLFDEIRHLLELNGLPPLPSISNELNSRDGYFVGVLGKKPQGPFSKTEVVEQIRDKKLSKNHFIFREDIGEWVHVFTHPDFDRRNLSREKDSTETALAFVHLSKSQIRKSRVRLTGMFAALVILTLILFKTNPSANCAFGNKTACREQALEWLSLGEKGRALDYLEKACLSGDGNSCHDTGKIFADDKNKQKAFAYFTKACGLKVGPSCLEQVKFSEIPLSVEAKTELWDRGCEFGSGEACFQVAILDDKEGSKLRASNLIERACQFHFAPACLRLAEDAEKVSDKALAFKFFERACNLESSSGCSAFGQRLYEDGKLVQAEKYFGKACLLSDSIGCSGAANMAFLRGDRDRGLRLAKRACELKDGVGCGLLASFYQSQNKVKDAQKYFGIACDLDSALSCFSLAQLKKRVGEPYQDAYSRACRLNKKYCRSI